MKMYYETNVILRAKTWRERMHVAGQLVHGVYVMLWKGEVRITVRDALVRDGDVVYVPEGAKTA